MRISTLILISKLNQEENAMAEMMTDPLQNELDSIDEKESRGRTVPTAGTKIVEVPDLRSLDGLIISRCADYLVNAINERLINGDLCSILNAAIITEEVSRDDCYFTDFTYWRLNQTDLLADIDAQQHDEDGGGDGEPVADIFVVVHPVAHVNLADQ